MISHSHDGDAINNMSNSMYELETGHQGLLKWKTHFQHYTNAWRSEVERRIGDLTGNIDGDADAIESSRLHEELLTQDQMRAVQGSIERKVVDSSRKEQGAVSAMVGNMRSKISGVMQEADGEEAQQAREMEMASEDMRRSGEAANEKIGEINGEEAALAAKAKEYQNRVAAANDELQGAMSLNAQEGNSQNQATNAKLTNLQNQIAALQAASSLAQTSQEVRRTGADGGQSQTDQEVAALEALNAQLRKENQALAAEDAKLDRRVAGIKSQLQTAGIKL